MSPKPKAFSQISQAKSEDINYEIIDILSSLSESLDVSLILKATTQINQLITNRVIEELERLAPAWYSGLPTTDETDSLKLSVLESEIVNRIKALKGEQDE